MWIYYWIQSFWFEIWLQLLILTVNPLLSFKMFISKCLLQTPFTYCIRVSTVMSSSPKRVVLCRNPEDRGHRTRGLGMRIVGGKIGRDGSLFAYVVWTVRGGPADLMGIKQGDKILQWDGISLVDKTFEEVCAIMDRSGDRVELLIDPSPDG